MKSKFFNLNFNLGFITSRLLLCIILFVFGGVLITSPAFSKTGKTDDAETEATKKVTKKTKDKAAKTDESDKPEKPDKSDKSDKNSPEDFGDGESDKSDKKPKKKDSQDDGTEDEHPVIPELENETYVELAKLGKLDEKQQKLLVKIQKQRKVYLEKWDKDNEKKLEKMKRKAAGEEKESRRATLELKVEKFEAQREILAAKFDTRARKVCKAPQLISYNKELLYRAAMNDFADVGLQLSDEEALKVKKACAELAQKRYRNPVADLTRNKKLQFQGIYAVAQKALTKEQVKTFKKAKIREEKEKQRSLQEEKGRSGKTKRSHRNK